MFDGVDFMSSSNASPTAFGWDFQVNAAIYLMLINIQEARAIRVEGIDEDIEITLNDGSKIYSQAKSVVKYDDYRNVLDYLKKALNTLNNASINDDVNTLIYVTNTPNPLNNKNDMHYFQGCTNLKYSELSNVDKAKIDKIINSFEHKHIDISKLKIVRIPFYGEDTRNRYKDIKRQIEEFLSEINITNVSISSRLMRVWHHDCFHNASIADTSVRISKGDFIWPVISIVLENTTSNNFLDELNGDDRDYIEGEYKKYIDYESTNYKLISKVLTTYQKSKMKINEFINLYWREFYKIVETFKELDENEKEILVKIILARIIKNRIVINNIKAGVNL